MIKKCKTSTYQKSLIIKTSRIRNCLADELGLSSSTLASFKSVIFNYYKSALAVSYDCENPRSFKFNRSTYYNITKQIMKEH